MRRIHGILTGIGLACAALAAPAYALDGFNDPLGGTIAPPWQALNGAVAAPVLVADGATTASADGQALALYGNQTFLVSGTEEWRSLTASVSILPLTAADSMQGLIVAASKGFSRANDDAYYLISFDRSDSFTAVHVFGNGSDVTGPFPGASLAGWLLPGNPHDGNYHELGVTVVRDNIGALLTVTWDGVVLGSVPADAFWNLRAPFGRVGLFTALRGDSDETRFDNFEAAWTDAPAPVTPIDTFTEPFGGTLDSRWFTSKSDLSLPDPTLVSEGGTLPSGDGQALQINGGQVMLLRGSEHFEDTNISVYIKPLADPNLSLQGIIGAVGPGFSFSRFDSYYYAAFLRFSGESRVRLGFNGGDSTSAFPGSSMDFTVPGDPLDGEWHKLTLIINRNDVDALWTVLWDDQEVGSFGPDPFWNDRAPDGRVGVFSYYRSPSEATLFDNFSVLDEVPVELSSIAID